MKNMLKNIMFAVAIGAIVVPSNTLDACNMCKRAREHNKNVKKVIGCVAGTTAALSAVAVALDWYLELGYITPYMQAGLEKAMPYLEDAYQQLPEMPESVKNLMLETSTKFNELRDVAGQKLPEVLAQAKSFVAPAGAKLNELRSIVAPHVADMQARAKILFIPVGAKFSELCVSGSKLAGTVAVEAGNVWQSIPSKEVLFERATLAVKNNSLVSHALNCDKVRLVTGSISRGLGWGAHWVTGQPSNLKDVVSHVASQASETGCDVLCEVPTVISNVTSDMCPAVS